MLKVDNISVYYGKVLAIYDVSIKVQHGVVVALLGGNGAGKSTLVNTISGLLKPAKGDIGFEGDKLDGLTPDKIVRRGIVQVPEGRKIFPDLTVEENLAIGASARRDSRDTEKSKQEVFKLFPRLLERSRHVGKNLSGGEQQMLAIGRALMAKPRFLMLDEPSLGLAPIVVREIFEIIRELNNQGTTVLLAEQNAALALKIANEAYIMKTGTIFKHDLVRNLLNDPSIREVYLMGG
jgi:branched-chain amino acid transport system ATP-binding protein